MTEKQGGSDVRANTTTALALGAGGPGEAYELMGHKWFTSAPMCDAFLMLAQARGGLSCFLVPRWRPDGSRNPVEVQRLKNKLGNVSNASSEIELRGALGWMVGDEGRGVKTIIEMVAMTRYDCMLGSSASQRQGVAQAIHHAAHRSAFGRTPDRAAADAQRPGGPAAGGRGFARAGAAHGARAGRPAGRPRAPPAAHRRCPSASTGSASAVRPMPTRRWNAWAATA